MAIFALKGGTPQKYFLKGKWHFYKEKYVKKSNLQKMSLIMFLDLIWPFKTILTPKNTIGPLYGLF